MSDYVCEELLVDIFERLPIKSLLRFRSVSKSWRSCISSIVLIRICNHQKVHVHHEDYRGYNEFEDIYNELVVSCNGILSLRDLIDDDDYICLVKFSVRRTLTLPNHSTSRDSVAYGFGFDPTACDYKIVGICYSSTKGTIHTSFSYSLKTDTWTEIVSPSSPFYDVKSLACFVNGSLYWLVKRVRRESSTERECFILTFNLSSHVFGNIYLEGRYCWKTTQVIVYNGSLAVSSRRGHAALILGISGYNSFAECSYMTTLERDRFDMIRGVQCTTNGDLSFNTYNVGLELMEFGPYCYG